MVNEADWSRGSHLHGFSRFRSDALPNFLDDLDARASIGLPDAVCDHVQDSFRQIRRTFEDLPKSSFLQRFGGMFEQMEQAYVEWNKVGGESDAAKSERRLKMSTLRDRRRKLARLWPEDQLLLMSEFDYSLVDSLYTPLIELTNDHAGIFGNLKSAIARFRGYKSIDKSAKSTDWRRRRFVSCVSSRVYLNALNKTTREELVDWLDKNLGSRQDSDVAKFLASMDRSFVGMDTTVFRSGNTSVLISFLEKLLRDIR